MAGTSNGILRTGGVFDPSELNPAVWYDFSDTSLLFIDEGITAVSNDGDAILQVNDKSNNGKHAIQSILGKRPLYKTGIQNTLSVGRFDGVAATIATSSLELSTFFTMFIVQRCTLAKPIFIEHSANANDNSGFFLFGTDASMLLLNRTSALHHARGVANWAGSEVGIITSKYNGSHLINLNGVEQNNSTVLGSPRSNIPITATLNIYSRNGVALRSDGDLMELIIYNTALLASDILNVEDFLTNKWGV